MNVKTGNISKRGRHHRKGIVSLKEKLKRQVGNVVKLPSGNIFAKPAKQLGNSLDDIHVLLTKDKLGIHAYPSYMAELVKRHTDLENIIKETFPSGKGGLVYLARSLGVSLDLDVRMKQPADVMFDVCVILPRGAPIVLSVIQEDSKKRNAISRYNIYVTKALIRAVRKFTNENFNALYGVVTYGDISSAERFAKAYVTIEKESSCFCIPESLSMSDVKYVSITKAFSAVASSTKVVQMLSSDKSHSDMTQTWLLTQEQFVALSENIDKDVVTVKADSGTGATTLMLEVASRLNRSGFTLLVCSSPDLCKNVRKQKLCSRVMVADAFCKYMKQHNTLPAHVKHVVCEGSWSPRFAYSGHVWCFLGKRGLGYIENPGKKSCRFRIVPPRKHRHIHPTCRVEHLRF
ncbi:uncharacterized protein LOC124113569 isoform X3 [Haliotis rufescens]|uniref:uncharacterized protein LOC124113569 isoform X3 n=1 Tax=Haliotis rufescens TaxID=6454 RepID=UPI00201F1432|nr:uncharacterized protein LOC124113569 isoform X3 [Haliotis rufescens]